VPATATGAAGICSTTRKEEGGIFPRAAHWFIRFVERHAAMCRALGFRCVDGGCRGVLGRASVAVVLGPSSSEERIVSRGYGVVLCLVREQGSSALGCRGGLSKGRRGSCTETERRKGFAVIAEGVAGEEAGWTAGSRSVRQGVLGGRGRVFVRAKGGETKSKWECSVRSMQRT